MPKLKMRESDQRLRDFRAAVAKQMAYLGISKEDLTTSMRMSRSTLWAKLKSPDQFRVGELRLLYSTLRFSPEDQRIVI